MKKKPVLGAVTPKCEYCALGSLTPDNKSVLCPKKGIMDKDEKCRKYEYDPLKRVPKPQQDLQSFRAEDFSLEPTEAKPASPAPASQPAAEPAPTAEAPVTEVTKAETPAAAPAKNNTAAIPEPAPAAETLPAETYVSLVPEPASPAAGVQNFVEAMPAAQNDTLPSANGDESAKPPVSQAPAEANTETAVNSGFQLAPAEDYPSQIPEEFRTPTAVRYPTPGEAQAAPVYAPPTENYGEVVSQPSPAPAQPPAETQAPEETSNEAQKGKKHKNKKHRTRTDIKDSDYDFADLGITITDPIPTVDED